MASYKEPVVGVDTPNKNHIQLSEEESVELMDESVDKVDEKLNEEETSKRKSSSGVWAHFTTIEVEKDWNMIKKYQCNHCKKTYKPQTGGITSQLLRHLKKCPYVKRLRGYALRDSNFEWSLMDDEWDRAEKVCKLLEVFLDATKLFSGTSYLTANLFLVEIFKVEKEITNAFISNDHFLEKMGKPMFDKFEKYWGEIGVLMSIASILDPRFKVSISWTFGRLYPHKELNSRVEDVIGKLESLYEKYAKEFHAARAANSSSTSTSSRDSIDHAREDDFYAFLKSIPVENTRTTELEVYLEEPNYIVLDNKEFDVLKWWSQSSSKFPILSEMARNIFCIPITTVASESAFSAGGRILDDYRSSLSKDTVELLVCGGDWIKSMAKTIILTLECWWDTGVGRCTLGLLVNFMKDQRNWWILELDNCYFDAMN